MSINRNDVERWRSLGWFGRLRRRWKYSGMSYREAYKTLEWDEYTYWVFSNCDYVILSGASGLLPDIMKTPVAERERESQRRKGFDKSIDRLLTQMKSRNKN